MALTTFNDFSTTPASNIDVNGTSIQGTAPVSNFDNALRELMAILRRDLDNGMVYTTKAANYTAVANDNNAYLRFSAAATLTLTAAATLGAGWNVLVVADGGAVIIDPDAGETINGATTITVPDGYSTLVICDGTNFGSLEDFSTISTALAAKQSTSGELYRGFLNGLTLSNNVTDATNDIDIAAGSAGSDGATPTLMTLSSAMTKRLDAAWAVGTNQGMLDTGSIGNGTYHLFEIQRSDTLVTDILASLSATSPTMPTSYDRKRRIGSILRESATIVPFTQIGDEFLRKAAILSITAANPGTSAVTRTLNVPTGVVVWAKFNYLTINASNAVNAAVLFTPLDVNDQVAATVPPSGALASTTIASNQSGNTSRPGGELTVRTNTSAQIRSRLEGSDANVTLYMSTLGWTDPRGRI